MDTNNTLEAVKKLLEIQQKILSNPERQEIDELIHSSTVAFEEQLLEVERIEADLSSIEQKISELISSRDESKQKLEDLKQKAERTESTLVKLKEERDSLLRDYAELEVHKASLVGLSNTLTEVFALLPD